MLLHADALEPSMVRETLNVILKRQSDILTVAAKAETLTFEATKVAAEAA
jgi:hypothetical protein